MSQQPVQPEPATIPATQPTHEPIAIIGMGCRFPGPAGQPVTTPAAFWQLLRSGADIAREIPAERWDIDAWYDPNPDALGKMYVRQGYFLEDVGHFDPQFFNLAPREVVGMDPQQRLLLETSWEALEAAGIAPADVAGSQTGIFISSFWDDYSAQQIYAGDPAAIDRYATLSNLRSMGSGRLAHLLGVHGPNLQVDTACSASLTALHLACQSLHNHECDLAFAGGVYLLLTPEIMIGLCRMGALAADGRSKTFDRRADGFAIGEGCGMVLLKRLADAQADGDPICAIIRGSALNHDGHSRTVTTPNGHAQRALLRQALRHAGVAPQQIQYVEAHGTGTELGDPIEVLAIADAFCQERSEPLAIGSVKSNIGHLSAAAGMAGLFKIVLALQHEELPPSLHINQLNPRIPWQRAGITVPTQVTPWPAQAKPRLAGLSAFGLNGSNAHVIIEEAPRPDRKSAVSSQQEQSCHLFTLSARSEEGLRDYVRRCCAFLAEQPTMELGDLCYTVQVGRSHFAHRLSVACTSPAHLQEKLQGHLEGQAVPGLSQGIVSAQPKAAKTSGIAFLFTGQGAQYVGMGRELYETQPAFRATLDRCDELLHPLLGESLLKVLYADPASGQSEIDDTTYTQPALFALEYALATLWQSWGVQPALLIGHSIGELAAACVAGVFSLEDGLKLVAARGRLMGALPQDGEMVSLRASEARVQQALAPHRQEVSIAAINGPQSIVISGQRAAVLALAEQLAAEGVKSRRLTVSHAFHSPLMEPMLAEFREVAEGITYHKPQLRLISNVTGKVAGDEITTPDYWVRHVREAVRFADGVQTLHEQGASIFLEIGPKPTLLGLAEQVLAQQVQKTMLPSLRENHPDRQQMLTSLGELYVRGVALDWHGFDRDRQHRKIVLPTYPFQRQRYWIEPSSRTRNSNENHTQQAAAQIETLLYAVAWERQTNALTVLPPATPGRWLVLADAGGVGQALAEQLLALGEQVECVPATADLTVLKRQLIAPPETALPLRGIVHLWGLAAHTVADAAALLQQQEHTLGSVLQLVQALATATSVRPRLWLATTNAQQIGEREAIAVAQTPLWGLGRVIGLEHPDLWGGMIDLEGAAEPMTAAKALLAALLQPNPEGETQVAYRQGVRHVARLVRGQRKPATDKTIAVRADAAYLITGGLGALGLQVAAWLAEQGAKQIILTGRRGITDAAQQAAVNQLTDKGVAVQIARIDVADEPAMRQLFAELVTRATPLKGVFHAAGALDDGILLNQTWERFANVLAAKVTGSWLLHQLTQTLDLDVLVFFSSVASLLGNPGQGNYAAANAFMDGLARYRQQQGLPGLSINWGGWADAGMAARTSQNKFAVIQPMASELGVQALARLLPCAGQMGVAAIDWTQVGALSNSPQPFLRNFVAPQPTAAPAQSSLIQELAALPTNRRMEHLSLYLQQAVGRVMGVSYLPERAIGFSDLGMDSLMAVELKRQIERALDVALPTTLAFEYPTVEALATHLLQDVLALSEANPLPVEALRSQTSTGLAEPIAVISLACRFPGAATPEAFWRLLQAGVDTVQRVPATRWPVDDYYDPQRPLPGKMYTREAAFVDDVDQFDPLFFGIAPREAVGIDPQHRLLLEVSWEAFERAGLTQNQLTGSQTGVFVGIGEGDYGALSAVRDLTQISPHAATSSGHCIAAGRLSYTLGLQGPAMAVDTACSSSLVALHLACQSLRAGECDLALAGGVSLMLSPTGHVALSQMQALSPDGRCKTFDAAADGYGRGEGCGLVLLKRLSQAEADGDTVFAIIKGSALNHDGLSSGLTVPNKRAQEKVLRQALANADVTAPEVSYIEAHGTGTPLGDPIELRALGAVFGRKRETPLLVGSVKTNIGHLEAAAGIAGFIKVVLSLHHGQLPAHLHFHTPNPYIEWDEFAIAVPTTLQPWQGEQRVAGVSSFGLSGTNAHLVVANAARGDKETRRQGEERSVHLLTLSAKQATALPDLAAHYLEYLNDHTDVDLADLCYSAAVGRNHFPQRLSIVAADSADLQAKLTTVRHGESAAGVGGGSIDPATPHVAFLFTGQGAQYVGMGRELYETQPTFRATIDRCNELLRPLLGESLLKVLYLDSASGQSKIDATTYTQPALFALEYALATLWQSWGIQPDILIGHSIGELAAACVAGVFSLEDGLKLVAARGRLMGVLPQDGEMVSLLTDEARAQAAIDPYRREVSVATINGPQNVVISGRREAVQAIAEQLAAEGIKTRKLTVSHAFHSPLMEPMLTGFANVAKTIAYHQPKLRLVSNLTGKLAGDEIATADYWVRHVREAVRFADGVQTLHEQNTDIFLEIGPKPTLLGMAGQMTSNKPAVMLASLRENQSDWQAMLTSLGELYVRGIAIDWQAFDQDYQRRKVTLPTYPFQRQRYWVDAPQHKPGSAALRPLIDKKLWLPRQKQTIFEKAVSADTLPFLADHHVYGEVVVPGACHLALALSGADLLFAGAPCVVEDVIFPQAMALLPEEVRTVQLVIEAQPGARSASSFQIISFNEAETEAEPLLHATGRIARSNATAPGLSLSDLQARCTATVLPATLYEIIAETQVTLGPTFRWFAGIWQGEKGEALAALTLPDALASVQGYPLFPSLIDACFQLVGAAMMGADETERTTLLPFALESLTLHGSTNHQNLWCHAQQVDETRWNIVLFTADGQVIAQLTGFQMRAVPPTAIQSNRLRTDWLHTLRWEPLPLPDDSVSAAPPECWLLVGDDRGLGDTLHAQLVATDAPVYLAAAPTQDGTALRSLVAELAASYHSLGVVYLSGVTTGEADDTTPQTALDLCSGLLQLTQALLDTSLSVHLWVVTRAVQTISEGVAQPAMVAPLPELDFAGNRATMAGCATFSDELSGVAPAAGALWGLGRTLAQEQPQLHCVCLDLDRDTDDEALATLLRRELLAGAGQDDAARQIAWRNGTRYAAQLTPWQAPPTLDKAQPQRLQLSAYGSTANLTFVPLARRSPELWEIEVEVKAAGLNFRDVLNALGLLQDYYAAALNIHRAEDVGLGLEFAGVVTAVGAGVQGIQIGDRVMGLAHGAFAHYLTLAASAVVPIPTALTFAEAATLPVTFLTAWYALVELANLQPGERVLIHAAAGGVGQAAVQIARLLGAEVIASASPGKWGYLRQQGITQLVNSRTLDFTEDILQMTGGAGVDVVLNSLNGDFIERSLAALGQSGRFVEIGKVGIWSAAQVAAQRPDVQYAPFDIGEVGIAEPPLHARLWQALLTRFAAGDLQPLPHTTFSAVQIGAAFRRLQQTKSVGKVVITFDQPAPVVIAADASYLITGGLGGLGLQVAQQLVADGARHLVLTGRRGVTTDEQQAQVAQLTAAGATVEVVAADIGNQAEVMALLTACQRLAPLRGIVHAAGVLDDGVLTEQTPARFASVMQPKVTGTWHLHTLTQNMALDFLVCFSSAAALLGSPGQSNYAAANAFMDTLMQQRRQQSLPGLSINWGGWAEVGMAAHLQARLQAMGMGMINPQQGRSLFHYLLQQPVAQIGVLPIRQQPSVQAAPVQRISLPEELTTLPANERRLRLDSYLRGEIAIVLGLRGETTIDARTRLFDFGLDSLMAVELRNRIQAGLQTSIRSTLLFDYPTLEMLTPYLLHDVLQLADLASPNGSNGHRRVEEPLATDVEELSSADLLAFIDQKFEDSL